MQLSSHLDDLGIFTVLNTGEATHIKNSSIDLTLVTNDLAPICSWNICDGLLSDHYAIELHVSLDHSACQSSGGRWITKNANWGLFNQYLEENVYDTPVSKTVDEEAHILSDLLDKTLQQSFKKTKARSKTKIRPLWQYDEEYIMHKNIVNRLTKSFRLTKSPETLAELRQAQKAARKVASAVKRKTWLDWCAQLDHSTSVADMWKKLRSIEGKSKPQRLHPDPEVEANRLINNYTSRSSPTQLPADVKRVQDQLKSNRLLELENFIKISDDTDQPFMIHELIDALSKRKNTAPGEDGFTFSIIQKTCPAFKSRLLNLFNMSWKEGKLPIFWKNAIIHGIPKPSDPDNPRPISLLSVLDKILEKMVHSRLLWKIGPLDNNIRAYLSG
jgi:hypothetical protein